MCASTEGAAGFTIMNRFFVEIEEREGSFVAIHGGNDRRDENVGQNCAGFGT